MFTNVPPGAVTLHFSIGTIEQDVLLGDVGDGETLNVEVEVAANVVEVVHVERSGDSPPADPPTASAPSIDDPSTDDPSTDDPSTDDPSTEFEDDEDDDQSDDTDTEKVVLCHRTGNGSYHLIEVRGGPHPLDRFSLRLRWNPGL